MSRLAIRSSRKSIYRGTRPIDPDVSRVLSRILALCVIAVCRSAEEEYDYEEEAVAPVTPAPAKPAAPGGRLGGLLSARGRANVANVAKKRPSAVRLRVYEARASDFLDRTI